MEGNDIGAKYQKLATEYSKIRAQAGVLKRAVLEEQNKNSCLRETLRLKDTNLRRYEQEIDSLGFRNKQLEHRVAALQEDLEKESKKHKGGRGFLKSSSKSQSGPIEDSVISEELQKRILENAELTSKLADKDLEIQIYTERIKELEQLVTRAAGEHDDVERKLRKENAILGTKISELEAKIAEGTSHIGSEDALSFTGSDSPSTHANHSTANEERIAQLEKELNHWRTQYEVMKIEICSNNKSIQRLDSGNIGAGDESNPSKEKEIVKNFTQKIESLLREKCLAESKLISYTEECESLQKNLELMYEQAQAKENEMEGLLRQLQLSEDNLTSTHTNYEQQISVLTEQVINLSEQLSSSSK